MDSEEQKHFDWIKRVYGDWEEHKFMIQMVERLKAENDLLCKAINDQQTQRWKMKQDKMIVEEERDKLKGENDEMQTVIRSWEVDCARYIDEAHVADKEIDKLKAELSSYLDGTVVTLLSNRILEMVTREDVEKMKVVYEKERDKLKAENRELKLEAIAAEAIKYHPEEDGHTREAKLREALEEHGVHTSVDCTYGDVISSPDRPQKPCVCGLDEALKGDSLDTQG